MHPRALAALAALALLQTGALLLHRREEAPVQVQTLVAGLDRQAVTRIRLIRRGEAPVDLRRQGSTWQLMSPIRGRADAGPIERLLSETEFLTPLRPAGEGASPRALGLDPPDHSLVLDGGGQSLRLDIGRRDPLGQGVYLRRQGADQRIVLVSGEYRDLLDLDSSRLLDHRLVGLEASDIERLVLTAGPDRLELYRRGDRWLLSTAGFTCRAHLASVRAVLAELSALTAARLLPPDTGSSSQVSQGELFMDVTGSGQRALLRRSGRPCPGHPGEEQLGLRRPGESRDQTACAASALLDRLRPGPLSASLSDLGLVALSEPEIEAIRLDLDGREALRLRRGPRGWSHADGEPADDLAVAAWVDALRKLRGRLTLPGAAETRSRPSDQGAILSLTSGTRLVETLIISPPFSGQRRVHRLDDGAWLLVDEEPLKAVLAGLRR